MVDLIVFGLNISNRPYFEDLWSEPEKSGKKIMISKKYTISTFQKSND